MSYEGHVEFNKEFGWIWYVLCNGQELARHKQVVSQDEAFHQMYRQIKVYKQTCA